MSVLSRLDRYWYAPMPATRLAVLRVLVGAYALVYLLIRSVNLASVAHFAASEFEPVGPVRLLSSPLSPLTVQLSVALTCLLGLAFVLGLRYRVCGPLFGLSFLWVTSYRSSFGMIFHTENLLALHLLLLCVAPAADAYSLDARGPQTNPEPTGGRYGWVVRAMCLLTVCTYVLAGIAKLRLAGANWVGGDVLRGQVAYDNLRKIELGSLHSPLGAWLVRYDWPFRVLAWLSMFLELGAPLALLGSKLARIWVVGVFGFHWGVVALMAIGFPYQLSCIAYLSFFQPERLVPWGQALIARYRGRQ